MRLWHLRGESARVGIFPGAAFVIAMTLLVPSRGYTEQPRAELQTATPIPPVVHDTAPDLDSLAKRIAEDIGKKKISTVVVVGGGGPGNTVTELGAGLRDAFNESLARQTQGAHVIDTSAARAMLRENRVSEAMLYTDVIAAWIAGHASADAYVTFRIYGLTGSRASLVAELFTQEKQEYRSSEPRGGVMTLRDAQVAQEQEGFAAPENVPGALAHSEEGNFPKCVLCPGPTYSEEGRKAKITGSVLLQVVVRPDGLADDILVTKPLGHGLDAQAIDSVLASKFEPAKDADGHPVAMQMVVQPTFQLYGNK